MLYVCKMYVCACVCECICVFCVCGRVVCEGGVGGWVCTLRPHHVYTGKMLLCIWEFTFPHSLCRDGSTGRYKLSFQQHYVCHTHYTYTCTCTQLVHTTGTPFLADHSLTTVGNWYTSLTYSICISARLCNEHTRGLANT